MDLTVLIIFAVVYLGMVLGRIPGFALDRTGVALLGTILLLAFERTTMQDAWMAIDVTTIALLLGLMIVSAQFRLGGFYSTITRRLAKANVSPSHLLALLIAVVGLLSAILANDIVCLAMTPVLIDGCIRRGLNPLPYLLALACAANIGSAATLIGNPQNMLIGQTLHLPFAGYLAVAAFPSVLGLCIVWLVIRWQYRTRWTLQLPPVVIEESAFDRWQTIKAIVVTTALMAIFLFTDWPRDVVALTAAGILLASRKMASRQMLGLVDWQLLVLFAGLFIVNYALAQSGMMTAAITGLRLTGLDPSSPAPFFVISVVLANVVSNVPSTMLLLPIATHPLAGPILAIAGTFAGNLIVVGSIANIIVIDQAARLNVQITWSDHARTGIPVTILTLVTAGLWLWLVG